MALENRKTTYPKKIMLVLPINTEQEFARLQAFIASMGQKLADTFHGVLWGREEIQAAIRHKIQKEE